MGQKNKDNDIYFSNVYNSKIWKHLTFPSVKNQIMVLLSIEHLTVVQNDAVQEKTAQPGKLQTSMYNAVSFMV